MEEADGRKESMSINSINNSNVSGLTAYEQTKNVKRSEKKEGTEKSKDNDGVVYESSMSESDRAALIEQLKASNKAQVDSFRSMVTDMLKKQGKVFENADDMWKTLASGDFTVDEETANKAKEAISEDGYWGVKQTSERIFEMAKALSGGDSEKMDDMLEAFKKGFDEAGKTWGKDLPDISNKTYDAVMKKFEDYKNQE